MGKGLGILLIAAAAGIFAISRATSSKKAKNQPPIDQVANTYQNREQYVPQQKSDVVDPMSMNATNIPIINSTPIDASMSPVSLYDSPRL